MEDTKTNKIENTEESDDLKPTELEKQKLYIFVLKLLSEISNPSKLHLVQGGKGCTLGECFWSSRWKPGGYGDGLDDEQMCMNHLTSCLSYGKESMLCF